MAVNVVNTIVGAARPGIKEFVKIEGEKFPEAKNRVNVIKSTLEYERFKQLSDFGYPQPTTEGDSSYLDNKVLMYSADFTPLEYTLMFGITKKAQFTDQYNIFTTYKQDIADTFVDLDALLIANLFNNGFSASYTGIDGVALFSTAHPYLGYPTWSNRPSTDLALDATNLQTILSNMRKIKTARQRPMRFRKGVVLHVPPALEWTARQVVNSVGQAFTADNTSNEVGKRVMSVDVDEDLTSDTAYFVRSADKTQTGLFYLEQMPFDILSSPDWDVKTRTMYVSCYKSMVCGWKHAHRVYGTTGA